jgi:dTDP-4-dehydrorhamnose 3,5-epimerase
MGALYDVMVDLRPNSPTFLRHLSVILSAENRRMVYIPEGFAHGFLTLRDETEVFYQMSEPYVPECSRGLRWNDSVIAVEWPAVPHVISEKDQSYPDFSVEAVRN